MLNSFASIGLSNESENEEDGGGLKAWVISLIATGGALLLALVIVLTVLCKRNQKLEEMVLLCHAEERSTE